jgi:hypothetical protein
MDESSSKKTSQPFGRTHRPKLNGAARRCSSTQAQPDEDGSRCQAHVGILMTQNDSIAATHIVIDRKL